MSLSHTIIQYFRVHLNPSITNQVQAEYVLYIKWELSNKCTNYLWFYETVILLKNEFTPRL